MKANIKSIRVKISRHNSVLRETGRANYNLKLLSELEKEFADRRWLDTKMQKKESLCKHVQEK